MTEQAAVGEGGGVVGVTGLGVWGSGAGGGVRGGGGDILNAYFLLYYLLFLMLCDLAECWCWLCCGLLPLSSHNK